MSLEYQRLANGKYSYTTTVQVISPEEFTNRSHSYTNGYITLKYKSNTTSKTAYELHYYPQIFQAISSYDYNICNTSSTTVLNPSSYPVLISVLQSTKTINGITYYGISCTTSLVMLLKKDNLEKASNTAYDTYSSISCNFDITYIPNGQTNITTKTVKVTAFRRISSNDTSALSNNTVASYLGLGMSVGDFILSIKATPVE